MNTHHLKPSQADHHQQQQQPTVSLSLLSSLTASYLCVRLPLFFFRLVLRHRRCSILYALEHLHAPLVVVMGHESCGAVQASLLPDDKLSGEPSDIVHLVQNIRGSKCAPCAPIVSKACVTGACQLGGARHLAVVNGCCCPSSLPPLSVSLCAIRRPQDRDPCSYR